MSRGFTLAEMLVALMVLGVAAGTMSMTMGTAFKSYERLSDVSDDLRERAQLRQVMSEVSGRYWLPDGKQKQIVFSELKIDGPYFQNLSIEEDDGIWMLYAGSADKKTQIFEADMELRFAAHGTRRVMRGGNLLPYDYRAISLERLSGDWKTVMNVPLKIDEDPACRFDIVGRQCR